MSGDVDPVQRTLTELAARLGQVEARLAALEEGTADRTSEATVTHGALDIAARAAADGASGWLTGVLALWGRAFLVLGGAFLLRALTEEGVLPAVVGVVLGFGYAGFWLVAAERSGGRGARGSASMHGVTAIVVALPLVVEAVARFAVLSGTGATVLLALATTAACVVAVRHRLRAMMWCTVIGSLAVAMWLFVTAGAHLPATAFVLAVGAATAIFGRTLGWTGARWLAALAADLLVLVLVQALTAPGGGAATYADLTPAAVVMTAIALALAYLALVAVPILAGSGAVDAFDMAQVPAALVVGVGGIALVVRATTSGGSIVGAVCVALGVACYATAFAVVDRRLGRNQTFYFITTLGLTLALAGVLLPMSRGAAALVWGVFGLLLAAVGGRFDRITLRAHAAVLLVSAAAVSTLPAAIGRAFGIGADPHGGAWLDGSAAFVLAFLVTGYGLLVAADRRHDGSWNARLPRFAILLPAVAGLGAALVAAIAAAWPGTPAGLTTLAALRSIILATATVVLAVLSRRSAVRELGWLVYPLLVLTGVRLLLADLRYGNAASLMVAFGAFGAALILAPRLVRRGAVP